MFKVLIKTFAKLTLNEVMNKRHLNSKSLKGINKV